MAMLERLKEATEAELRLQLHCSQLEAELVAGELEKRSLLVERNQLRQQLLEMRHEQERERERACASEPLRDSLAALVKSYEERVAQLGDSLAAKLTAGVLDDLRALSR